MHRIALTSLLFAMLSFLVWAAPATADTRAVRIEGKTAAEYVAAQTRKDWAVVIGIDEYPLAAQPKHAVSGAKAIAELLEQQGFQVTALYNIQATRNAILKELGERLTEQVDEQDRVLIYFAGHVETRKMTDGKTIGHLVPVDGKLGDSAKTGISMGLIKYLANALPARQVLLLVDDCYGGIPGKQLGKLTPMTGESIKQITRERGRQLITAGGPGQEAAEERGHSVFTHSLLEGLGKGLADLNDDGIIPASELYAYLAQRVSAAAQQKGRHQRPELWALAAEKGEVVFIPNKTPMAAPPAQASGGASADEVAALKNRLKELEDKMDKMLASPPRPQASPIDEERRKIEEERRRMEAEKALLDERKKLEAEKQALEDQRKKLEGAQRPPLVASVPSTTVPKGPRADALKTVRAAIEGERSFLDRSARPVFDDLATDYFVVTQEWEGNCLGRLYCPAFKTKMRATFQSMQQASFKPAGTLGWNSARLCFNADAVEWEKKTQYQSQAVCVEITWLSDPDVESVRRAIETLSGKRWPAGS